ncbi:hypothetical protein BOTBODRAFT_56467 [Botryobasidium botryosum FD-172 SS1]|uniref:Uncharacterized protein n=1 Tax=Botryobasidium botryosum (strain FD-172 SS1) TaxID=930990 RepID=A0A067MB05_BOTB1|nr:hypothetical protein BOTBODRAFT_56467 [Botryobasidium botryosum FD-172 SS1]
MPTTSGMINQLLDKAHHVNVDCPNSLDLSNRSVFATGTKLSRADRPSGDRLPCVRSNSALKLIYFFSGQT